jgi:CubicO group peptidase (beta-lactamase class C family)
MRHKVLVLFLLLTACRFGDDDSDPPRDVNPGLPPSASTTPENTGDGWMVSTAAAEDIDATALTSAFNRIREGEYPRVDSMVVARHGRLVAEGYFNGFGRDSLHDLRSTGKSFTSALVGIAVEQGLLGVDDLVSGHIPNFDGYANMSDRKRAITIRHLLNMSSGLACDDWVPSSPGQEEKMYARQDWIGFVLDLPAVFIPGSVPQYCTGGVVLLGHIVSLRSGMELDAYAQTYLFDPLGIRESTWRRSPDGRATGGGGLRLKPRDAAKLGQLYLAGGVWNGAQVVPAAWVAESALRVNRLGSDGYGFLWWKRSFPHPTQGTVESFFTSGNGGNYVFVIPALDLVVTFTASNYNSRESDLPFEILTRHVLPAVR